MLPNTNQRTAPQPGSPAELVEKEWLLAATLGGVAQQLTPVRIWIEYQVETVGYFVPVAIDADHLDAIVSPDRIA